MKIRIETENDGTTLVVLPDPAVGMCVVGRGASLHEALGSYLIGYQKELGITDISLSAEAQVFETERRRGREDRPKQKAAREFDFPIRMMLAAIIAALILAPLVALSLKVCFDILVKDCT